MARPGRALVYLAEETVADLVGLPEGMRVVGVAGDLPTLSVVLLVESDDLEPVPPAHTPPTLAGACDVEYHLDDGGGDDDRRRLWVRWRWRRGQPPEPPRHGYGCGFGWCDAPARTALSVRTRRDVYSPQTRPGALLLCDLHAGTPPAGWDDQRPESAGGEPLFVVAGRYSDGSAVHDTVFGPYGQTYAGQVAEHLTGSSYQLMRWDAFPLARLWQPAASEESG